LASGARIDAVVLVKSFGGPNGMLIVTEYAKVASYLDALAQAGFGFCVLGEPAEHEPFVLEDLIEVLRDWGWSGSNEDEPEWIGAMR
jgi:hypothetical protein